MASEPTKREITTVADFLKAVPSSWRSAEIAIAHNDSVRAYRVERVSLQKNSDGRKVVVVHKSSLRIDKNDPNIE